jgi:hypothetical protein
MQLTVFPRIHGNFKTIEIKPVSLIELRGGSKKGIIKDEPRFETIY